MNLVRTGILLAGLTALFGVAGLALGGGRGLAIALGMAAVTNLFAWWNSDRLALRAHGAREVDAGTAPDLHRMVAELAARAGLPTPRVFLIDNPQPNAFATGRNPRNSAVAVTTGLLQGLGREEVAGVVAHELAHIRSRDTLTMTVAATLAGAISTVAQFGFLFGGRDRPNPIVTLATALVAPLAAAVIQFAISRSREYAADRDAALICGEPMWLASALGRIEAGVRGVPSASAERYPATAPLFIVNPLTGGGIDNLFSTHPATANRVAALHAMAAEGGRAPAGGPSRPGPAGPGAFTAGSRRSPWAGGGAGRGRPGG